jgi:Mn2+/Fe2+ NRAMP family transporter
LLGLFLFVIPGILIWLISVGHAILVINAKRADQRTEKIVSAMKNKNAKT